jgi:hypothetical protein
MSPIHKYGVIREGFNPRRWRQTGLGVEGLYEPKWLIKFHASGPNVAIKPRYKVWEKLLFTNMMSSGMVSTFVDDISASRTQRDSMSPQWQMEFHVQDHKDHTNSVIMNKGSAVKNSSASSEGPLLDHSSEFWAPAPNGE